MICSLFLHLKVDAILQIPLNPSYPEDEIVWNFTSNRVYTVKIGYQYGMDIIKLTSSFTSTSSSHHDTRLWNYIHQLQVQQKIKMFLWRAMQKILNLLGKIVCEEVCMMALNIFVVVFNLRMTGMLSLNVPLQKTFWNTYRLARNGLITLF